MCGRYLIDDSISDNELYAALYNSGVSVGGKSAKRGEIFPTDAAPVLVNGGKDLTASLMIWGFTKFSGKGVIINARAETAREKPMFANAIKFRRCVVPSSGFYEWRHDSRGKATEKLLFRLESKPVLYMAGLYKVATGFNGATNERPEPRFVVLTREPNDIMRPVHNRMPVILPADALTSWISDDSFIDFAFSYEVDGMYYCSA